jgi:hypothetical protein
VAYRAFHCLGDFMELPDGWEEFDFVSMPATVKCKECSAEFKPKYDEPVGF